MAQATAQATTQSILIVAGEASGDHYAQELVCETRALDPGLKFFGMGGDRMDSAGVELIEHVRNVQVMGFVEVLGKLRPLYRAFRRIVEEAEKRRPAAVVLVDFPGFNLRLAAKLRARIQAPILYYIGPTVWAWRPQRIDAIRKCVDKMLVIFPFEEPLYRAKGVPVEYVGHPLVGTVRAKRTRAEFRKAVGLAQDKPLIGLLPGSRPHEVSRILPGMREAARLLAAERQVEFALGLADTIDRSQVEGLLKGGPPVAIVERGTHDLMAGADALLVACGTAPLEAAILGTPMIVVYRTGRINYEVIARLIRVPHVCIVNLIMGREVVPEILQDAYTPRRAADEVLALLGDGEAAKAQRLAFAELATRLGSAGAGHRAAAAIVAAARGGREAARAAS